MVSIALHNSTKNQGHPCTLHRCQGALLVIACLYGTIVVHFGPRSLSGLDADLSSLLLLEAENTTATVSSKDTTTTVSGNSRPRGVLSQMSSKSLLRNEAEIEEIPEYARLPVDKSHHKLPTWMKDYFAWHRQQRVSMTADNWNATDSQYRFLILRCLNTDSICGGTSDRLQSLPFQLAMGYKFKRILMIYWERPFALEEFLLPPRGGLDWRVPNYMRDALPLQDMPLAYAPRTAKRLSQVPDQLIVWVRDQTHNHGRTDYNALQEELHRLSRNNNTKQLQEQIPASFDDVFHDAWRMSFTPSRPVSRLLEDWMHRLSLVPGEYASTHIRALYGVHNRSDDDIDLWARHALDCTTQLLPQGPYFVASDSTRAQRMALDYGRERQLHVVARFHDTPPLHLDKGGTEFSARQVAPADYYDVFVDLYLLGNSRGLAYNVGGYGKLGLLLGFNASNGIQHQMGGVPWKGGVTAVTLATCQFQGVVSAVSDSDQTHTADNILPDNSEQQLPLFVPPME